MATAEVQQISMSERDALSILAELSSRTPSPPSTESISLEIPLPTNIFLSNPLSLFISPPTGTEEPFFLSGSEAHNAAVAIGDKLSRSYESDSLTLLYSPTFKCYTSILFYAAIFTELRRLSAAFDESGKVLPSSRAVVWAYLYTLIGADKPINTSPLTPALDALTADASKLNVLEIEVLLLAFLLALHSNKHLLDQPLNQATLDSAVLKEQSTKVTMEFFNFLRYKTALGLKDKLAQSQKLLRAMGIATTAGQQPPSTRSSTTTSANNSPREIITQQEIDAVSSMHQLSMLRFWSPALEKLSPTVKLSIWKACKHMTALKRYISTDSASSASFSAIVASWMRSPLNNQAAITALFGAVCLLHDAHILTDEFKVDPSVMSKHLRELAQALQQQPRSQPPSPLPPPSTSPLNFAPVPMPHPVHGPRMYAGPSAYPMSVSPVVVSPSPPPSMMMMGHARTASPLTSSSSPLPSHMSAQAMVSAMGLGFMPPPNTPLRPMSSPMSSTGFVKPQPRMAPASNMTQLAPLAASIVDMDNAASAASKKRKLSDSASDLMPSPKSPKVDDASSPKSNAVDPASNSATMAIAQILT